MKKLVLLLSLFGAMNTSMAQTIEGHEIGIDGFVNASTIGGTYAFGLKYGMVLNENLVVGPSVRFQRSWSNNIGTKFSYNIYGGGLFLHARYQNVIYGALEFEMLNSPISYTIVNPGKNWVPTFFIGGGFSREFNELVRLNLGLYYDLINHVNSPFRQHYTFKITDAQTGQTVKWIPIIYRISFFFPIGR